MDVEHLQRPIQDDALRAIGEKTARRYTGYVNMGLSPVSKVRIAGTLYKFIPAFRAVRVPP